MTDETRRALLALPDGPLLKLYRAFSEECYAAGHMYPSPGIITQAVAWMTAETEPDVYECVTVNVLRAALDGAA